MRLFRRPSKAAAASQSSARTPSINSDNDIEGYSIYEYNRNEVLGDGEEKLQLAAISLQDYEHVLSDKGKEDMRALISEVEAFISRAIQSMRPMGFEQFETENKKIGRHQFERESESTNTKIKEDIDAYLAEIERIKTLLDNPKASATVGKTSAVTASTDKTKAEGDADKAIAEVQECYDSYDKLISNPQQLAQQDVDLEGTLNTILDKIKQAVALCKNLKQSESLGDQLKGSRLYFKLKSFPRLIDNKQDIILKNLQAKKNSKNIAIISKFISEAIMKINSLDQKEARKNHP